MQPFEIVEQDGHRVATNGSAEMVLAESDGRLFRRRAIKNVGTENAQPVEWAVAELDGVRAYFDGRTVVLSRKDLWP